MPWGRLDDGLYDHPKLDALGRERLAGIGLWSLAISWCNRRLTDGVIPLDRIRLLGGTTQLADRLVEADLFERHADGYAIHDFLEFNDSREQVEARREAAAERQRRHRSGTRDTTRESHGESRRDSTRDSQSDKGVGHASIARAPAAARPDPTESITTPQPPASGGRRTRARDLGPMRSPTRYDELLESDDVDGVELFDRKAVAP
jgi:hypothetical protein